MSNRDLLRLAPQTLIRTALSIDAEVLSTDPKVFISDNLVNYDLAINTLLLAVRDYAPYSWTTVATRIQRTGLAATVDYLGSAANEWLTTGDLSEYPLANNLLIEIRNAYIHRSMLTVQYESSLSPEGIFLFLCRYLKRFTPLHADILDKTAVSDFVQNQNRLKMLCRHEYNPFILDCIRDEVDYALLKLRTRSWSSIKMCDVELTPGTCFSLSGERLRSSYEKYDSLIKEYRYTDWNVFHDSVWSYNLGRTARLMTVPKTFKSARTIAPEECLRQAVAHRMFSLRAYTPEGIDLNDQTPNQVFARLGSLNGDWCTIDLSHASDDVTWVLVQDIYRDYPVYLDYLSRIRPYGIEVQGQLRLLQSFATMGNSMTFLVESEIFWLITKAAVHFAQRHGVTCNDNVIVYGDDIVCACEAYPFVVAFLEKLGFAVNERKSFASGQFRESCGKDYLHGEDVSSPYFPRRPLGTLLSWYRDRNSDLITTAESLISLQHRLMDVSPIAAQYIELYIREHKPTLGTVPAGTQSTDLWGLDHIAYATRYIPTWEKTIVTNHDPWVLENGRWRYRKIRDSFTKHIVEDEDHMVTYQLRPQVEVEIKELPEDLLYYLYLKHGPWYTSSLDELLGISTCRRLMPTGRPHSVWKKIEE